MTDELDLDALLSVADAATPGPWEYGDRWHIAGVLPGKFGKGRCVYCERHGTPTWTGELDINGQMMPAHVHTQDEPWHEHGMYALRDDGPVMVINDTDEYGYLEPEDAAFIATFDPPTVRQLIERLKTAEAELVEAWEKGAEWAGGIRLAGSCGSPGQNPYAADHSGEGNTDAPCDHFWSMGEAMAVDTCTKCGVHRDQYTDQLFRRVPGDLDGLGNTDE